MFFKVYDYKKKLCIDMDLDELTARITSYYTANVTEPELIKAFAVMARTELARKIFMLSSPSRVSSGLQCLQCYSLP